MKSKFSLILTLILLITVAGICSERGIIRKAIKVLRAEIITYADQVLYEKPVTITSFYCDRSAGGSIK